MAAPEQQGAADALTPEQSRWLRQLPRRHRGWRAAVMAPLTAGLLLIPQAALLAWALHEVVVAGQGLATIWPAVLALAGLWSVRAALVWHGERAGLRLAETLKAQLRASLLERLLAQPPAWSQSRASGALVQTAVDQVEALDGYLSRYVPAMILAGLLPLAFVVVIAPVEFTVAVLLLCTIPVIPLFMALVGWGAEAASRQHLSALARLSGVFADRLRGLRTLVRHGRAEAEAQAVAQATQDVSERTMRVLRIAFLSSAILEFFAALGVAGVALYLGLTYLGYIDLRSTPLSLQLGLFCLLMAPEVYLPIRQLAVNYHDRAGARAAVSGMAQLFETLPVVGEAPVAAAPVTRPDVPAGALGLAVTDLRCTAQRAGLDETILAVGQLTLAPGEHVVLLGASGSGKTTWLETLAGLRPYTGQVRLGGVELRDWPAATLAQHVACARQEPHLIHGSIRDNLCLGLQGVTDTRLAQAAAQAQVSAFADALPAGLATRIGTQGHGVSGGEARRLALARVLLRDPGLVLLDEPTAHLDEATEARVLDGILAFAQGRSLILATHSPAVAARFARVWEIREGQLVDRGALS